MEQGNTPPNPLPDGLATNGLAHEPIKGFSPESVEATAMYRELRRLAARELARFPRERELGVSSVVNRLFVRLASRLGGEPTNGSGHWASKAHFYGAAAKAMRHVIIEDCRRRKCEKRGGGQPHQSLDGVRDPIRADPAFILDLHDAMCELEAVDPEAHRVIELRFFGGLTSRQAGEVLGVSERTVERHANVGRAWLAHRLEVRWGTDP